MWMGAAAVSAAVILLTVTRWPYGALLLLTASGAMPVFFVELFGWKARPEHFAAGTVLFAIGIGLLFNKRRVRLKGLDYWILVYVVINFVSSAFQSPEPSATLRWALLEALAVLPYFLIRLLLTDWEVLEKAFRILLFVGLGESAYGILCYLSHHVFGTTFGMEVGQYLVDVAAPYASQYEPNLFGAYTACCAVLFLALYLAQGKNRLSSLIGFLIASLAAVLSFSRAALAALVVTAVWVFWKSGDASRSRRVKLVSFALGLGLFLLLAVTLVGGVLRERFGNLAQQGLAEETTITRLVITEEALREIPTHLFLGSGTASFNLTFDWAKYIPEWGGSKTWIGNAPVRILHDTGLLGLVAILGFTVSLWRRIRQILRGRDSQSAILLALSAGALVYCITFQSSDGTNLAFCWVQLGFLASAALLISDRHQDLKLIDGVLPRGGSTPSSSSAGPTSGG
jgi:O-antigen ligase